MNRATTRTAKITRAIARGAAACALLAASWSQAGPAPGTAISNRAEGSYSAAGANATRFSNTVTLTTSAAASLGFEAKAVCIRDTPWVEYKVTVPAGISTAAGVTFDWLKADGTSAQKLTGRPLTGRLLWPGAAVDAADNATAWPGWKFENGRWIEISDGLRPTLKLVATVNPTAELTLGYPPATPQCNAGPKTATLNGRVFNDADADGVLDGDESGISGVTVTLRNASGTTVGSATTDSSGRYAFTGLSAGTYTVVETDPAGYSSTTDNAVTVSLAAGGTETRNFGDRLAQLAFEAKAVCIRDTPWVEYKVTVPAGISTAAGVSFDWVKADGTSAQKLTGQPLSGRLLWPGASVDAAGNPTGWPGWKFENGKWVQISDGLRPTLKLVATVNPTAELTLGYPPATPQCAAEPPVTPGTVKGATLTNANTLRLAPGETVYFPHTLTNVGTASDTYALSLTELEGSFAFGTVAIFADANGDGLPDTATPLFGSITLGPRESFRFVVRASAPADALPDGYDRLQVNAASLTPGAPDIFPNVDLAAIFAAAPEPAPRDGIALAKRFSVSEGPSPYESIKVTIGWENTNVASSGKRDFTITDRIGAGFEYVPGSARWSGADGRALSDVSGADPVGISYDFGASQAGSLKAVIPFLPPGDKGEISFLLRVKPGRAVGEVLENIAQYRWTLANGDTQPLENSNAATYRVTGSVDLTLTGDRIALARPGAPLSFTNMLTNTGTVAERFDITLSGSTFPAGVQLALFQADGTTPLADTDGNGTPDTGVVAPGQSYRIVVKGGMPATAAPGEYMVTKTAVAASAPSRRASADDVVGAVAEACAMVFEPDYTGQVGFGQSVTYRHRLRNVGNCTQEVTFPGTGETAKSDSQPGWTSQAFLDNRVADWRSIVGQVDPTDTPVTPATRLSTKPGDVVPVLVRVQSPPNPSPEANVTVTAAYASITGRLEVVDRTRNANETGITVDGEVRNFTGDDFGTATIWGVIGRDLYLRVDASACNVRPDFVESRTVILTAPGGERETVTVTETGPNTGIFTAPGIPVRNPPVTTMNGTIEGRQYDLVHAEVLGCTRPIETDVTLLDPAGIVFDSATNQPVPGAKVALVKASGGRCGTTLATVRSAPDQARSHVPADNPILTHQDGRFQFPDVDPGQYCVVVSAPNGYAVPSSVPYTRLPPGRNLVVSGPTSGGSYGHPFSVGPGHGPVIVDVPADPRALSGLFVQKVALRQVAEVGDFVDYEVRVRNGTGQDLAGAPGVTLADDLPAGFAYVPGTARRAAQPITDPATSGPRLELALGAMKAGEEALVGYRVRIGPNALRGDGINRVRAAYTAASGASTQSNLATAQVTVTGGVFTERGYILGRVFLDCNTNGLQDRGEAGVPEVRLFLEDGTNVVTDGEGKFSFYGIRNRTHVLKVDPSTLPPGARLAVISGRHLGDGGSRLVDLKAGELARADFAVAGCEASVVADVKRRREAADRMVFEGERLVTQKLEVERVLPSDPKALPASGVVGQVVASGNPAIAPGAAGFAPAAPASGFTSPTPLETTLPQPPPAILLENLLPGLDNKFGFVDLKDGAVLPFAQATIRVKGPAGTTFRLTVNGDAVPDKRIGKRAALAEKQVQAWEFVGLDLRPGANILIATLFDPFGNERGREMIVVKAPDRLGKVHVELPKGGAVADGRTPVRVKVRLTDTNDTPVTVRTAVTLEASRGQWQVRDLDPNEPGVQVFVEGGSAEFALLPPGEPGDAKIRVSSGPLVIETALDLMPDLRDMVAAGVVEGTLSLRNFDPRALVPSRNSDGFEEELKHFSRTSGDGERTAGARAAFFLKGKVLGEYLLTAAYDSDKDTRERLFRDIQPDLFYPVYGDAAQRGFDAQSTSRLYVRVEGRKSWLLYGDYTTQAGAMDVRRLGNYTRSLTGARYHYEDARVSVNAFASKDATRQVIDELPANGTSGPYVLRFANGRVNSERVEILTRDRDQPSIVLRAVSQTRFVDYEIEPLTGNLLFKAPVASLDPSLNPNSIRVTYEVEQGGDDFWVGGVDGQVRLHDRLEVGGAYVEDRNPADPMKLRSVNATARLGEKTFVIAEAAQTDRPETSGKGNAGRVELKHEGGDLQGQLFVARTDKEFDNPGAYLGKGRGEAGGRATLRLSERLTAKAELLRTEDLATDAVRSGGTATLEIKLDHKMALEVGARYARELNGPAVQPGTLGVPSSGLLPDHVATVRARLTGPVPGVEGARVYGEAEVDVEDTDRRILAAGGEYQLPNRGRLYFRHEFVSSITGPYGLNAGERQNSTVFGLDTEYMKYAKLFSEYRVRDVLGGRDAEAALGLRNTWTVADGLRLGTNIERVHALSGSGQGENTALGVGLEYTGSRDWKGSARLEMRDSATTEGHLSTLGIAARIDRNFSFLGRNTLSIERSKRDDGERRLERLQAGIAYRDAETNRFDGLARVEHRAEKDTMSPASELKRTTELLSLHGNYFLYPPVVLSARYAAKQTSDSSAGITTKYRAQSAGGRLTWDVAPKWDFGIAASLLAGKSFASREYALGLEVGYLLSTNLWLSAGYNLYGYRDDDLAGADYTVKGPFVRLRYKFDESILPGTESRQ